MITRNDSGFTLPIRRRGIAMQVENENCPVSFISAEECGRFLAFLADSSLEGPVNAAASGTITIGEIIRYIEEKTGKKAVLSRRGKAPYNGFPGFFHKYGEGGRRRVPFFRP